MPKRELVAALGCRASAWISSTTMLPRPAKISAASGSVSSSARLSGVVSRKVGRRRALAGAAILGRVAGARLDRDGQAHLLDGRRQVARDVDSQRLERRDVEGVQAGTRRLRKLDQGGQEPGQRLAAARGGDQQCALARPRGTQQRELVRARHPAAAGEPGGEGFRQCSHGSGLYGGCRGWRQPHPCARIRSMPSPGDDKPMVAATRPERTLVHASGWRATDPAPAPLPCDPVAADRPD
jgi:hypothetical protein